MKNTVSCIAAVCCASLLLFSCTGKPADAKDSDTAVAEKSAPTKDSTAEQTQDTIYAVNVSSVALGSLADYLEFGGDVTAESSVDIYADVAGKVAVIQVEVGETVKKDDVLMYVDPSRPGMTYSISPVKASIGGTIISLPIPVGTMISQSVSLGKISDTDKLEIKISVPERFISKILVGQTAQLRFDAYPGEIFPATVVRVSPVLDTSSRTMQTVLQLDVPSAKIKAGMFARVKLITDRRNNIITIPYAAIVSRQGEHFVFIATEDEKGVNARRVAVKSGIRVDDKIEILEGVAVGDTIVIKGQSLLSDGSKLNIVSRTTED